MDSAKRVDNEIRMHHLIGVFFLFFCSFTFQSQIQWDWIIQGEGHPDSFGQSNTIHDILQSQDGYLYITGSFRDTIIFEQDTLISAGFDDAFVAKYDTLQNLQWVQQIAGTGVTDCKSIVEDPNGNIVLGGYFQHNLQFQDVSYSIEGFSNIFMFWLDPTGNIFQDLKTSDSNFGEIVDMVVNSEDDIIITGNFYGTLTKDNVALNSIGGQNFFVIKVNPDGFFEWGVESLEGGNLSEGVDVDSEDSIYICGSFEDGIIIEGTTYNATSFNHSTLVVKYFTDGSNDWVYTISGFNETHGKGISVNDFDEIGCIAEFREATFMGDSDTTLTGNLGYDGFFFLLDQNGQFDFVKVFGGINDDIPEDIDDDEFGNFNITGKFGAFCSFGDTVITSTGPSNTFLMKVNRDSLLWIETIAGTGVNKGQTVFSGQNEKVFLGGVLRNSIYFENDTLSTTSGKDFYLTSISDFVDPDWIYPTNIATLNNYRIFNVYPNPSSSTFTILLVEPILSLEIYDYKGRVLMQKMVNESDKYLEVNHKLPSGNYILKMVGLEQVFTSRLLVIN